MKSSESFTITGMTAEHLEQVYAVETASFAVPWTLGAFVGELNNPFAMYFVAVENGVVVGFAGMWRIVNEGHITNVAVLPSRRGRGIGRALVSRLCEVAGELELAGLTLEVRMNNSAAQKLYTSFGFEFGGIRKNYYSDTKEDAVIMWKYFEGDSRHEKT